MAGHTERHRIDEEQASQPASHRPRSIQVIHEIATLTIKPGVRIRVRRSRGPGRSDLPTGSRALSLRLDRSMENPSEYTLIVGWATVEIGRHYSRRRVPAGFVADQDLSVLWGKCADAPVPGTPTTVPPKNGDTPPATVPHNYSL
jgi:hypothetical protein